MSFLDEVVRPALLLIGVGGFVLAVLVGFALLVYDADAQRRPTAANGVTVEKVLDAPRTVWRMHDPQRGATCWFTYDGFECLPDGVLKAPTAEAP